MREEEFEAIIGNAIYTALYAEATLDDSAASRIYVNSVKALIPRWGAPGDLMEPLPQPVLNQDYPEGTE